MTTTAQQYDDIHNEGGEGYNPYRDTHTGPVDGPKTRADTADVLRHRLDISYRSDGRYSDELAGDRADWQSRLDAIDAAVQTDIDAEWTRGVTLERRADWNRRAPVEATTDGKIDMQKYNAMATRLGYGHAALKTAIARHGL